MTLLKESILSQEMLKDILSYDKDTGVFIWIKKINPRSGKVKVGNIAGGLSNGYRVIKINNNNYCAHRLAWLYIYGKWPKNEIDHINGIRSDNRIENLRDVLHSENLQNQRNPRKNSKLGIMGASLHTDGRYQAHLKHNGKIKYIGLFDTPEQAHEAYLIEKRKIHKFCTI
jgi:hypothetical protein